MRSFYRLLPTVALGGTAGGASVVAYILYEKRYHPVQAATLERTVKWNANWDLRDAKSFSSAPEVDQNNNLSPYPAVTKSVEKLVPKATRHILLVRHGHYQEDAKEDETRILTNLGREQADLTGRRLKELNLPYTYIQSSTMARAIETMQIIHKHVPHLDKSHSDLLREGAPIPPDPPIGHWQPDEKQYLVDGARIEAAFRKLFHRATPEQEADSYEVIVCHANVIRYFVCRALQFPPEGWLRMSLPHGSITWITIRPSGRVSMRCLGDSGHMPAIKVTYSF